MGMVMLFVGNLDYAVTDRELRDHCANAGFPVARCEIIMDGHAGKSKGFGFVEIDVDDARPAIETLDRTAIRGRTVRVDLARPRADQRQRAIRG